MPRPALPKLRLPAIAAAKIRNLAIALSALALIGGGALAWVFVRPLFVAPKPPVEAAGQAAEAAAGQPEAARAGEPDKAVQHAEAAAEKPAAGHGAKDHAEKGETDKGHGEPGHGDKGHAEPAHGARPEGGKAEEKHAVAPLPPPPPLDEPEILIRRLQDVQERVAAGDPAAFEEQPRLLGRIARRLEAQPPEIWAKPRNAHALVLYLLSGGRSTVGRKILSQHTFAASTEPLAKGAIAYLEGVEGADRDALLGLDPRALDYGLGAQLAFVQAILLTAADRPQAIAKLDLARLLSPGGLVEEAALRREVGLLSETGEFDRFSSLSRQYWQRFRASPYADNFLRQFLVSAARISLKIKAQEWAQLDEFVESLTPETRRALFLVVAQTAAVGGNFQLASMVARRALALSPADATERQRALLFRAAAEIATADPAQAAALLRDLDRSRLPPGDQPLHDAVALVAARLFRPPETKFAAPLSGDGEVDAALARAESSVKEADAVMDAVRKSMQRKSR